MNKYEVFANLFKLQLGVIPNNEQDFLSTLSILKLQDKYIEKHYSLYNECLEELGLEDTITQIEEFRNLLVREMRDSGASKLKCLTLEEVQKQFGLDIEVTNPVNLCKNYTPKIFKLDSELGENEEMISLDFKEASFRCLQLLDIIPKEFESYLQWAHETLDGKLNQCVISLCAKSKPRRQEVLGTLDYNIIHTVIKQITYNLLSDMIDKRVITYDEVRLILNDEIIIYTENSAVVTRILKYYSELSGEIKNNLKLTRFSLHPILWKQDLSESYSRIGYIREVKQIVGTTNIEYKISHLDKKLYIPVIKFMNNIPIDVKDTIWESKGILYQQVNIPKFKIDTKENVPCVFG